MNGRADEPIGLPLSPSTDTTLRRGFVSAMSQVAASVCVVTTDGAAGRFGQTVSAMMSVCADPPTLMVGLFKGAAVADAVRTNGCFAVSVLAACDHELAHDFAGMSGVATRYKFAHGWESLRTGSPVRTGSAASFDCHAEQFLVAGTHVLVVGRVVSATHQSGDALTYSSRSYGTHHPLKP